MVIDKKANNKDTIILERRFVPQGSVIMKQGEIGSTAFLIQSGMVRVYMNDGAGRTVDLATIGMGQIFGEMALVFDEPRSATVQAVDDCNLIVLNRDTFKHKLNRSDPTVKAIVPMLMKRIIESNNALLNKESTIEDMVDTVNNMYQNIHTSLSANKKQSMQNEVLPKLDEFLMAVKAFRERYKDED